MEWVLLSDKNIFDLLSSVYTAVNAININSNINNLIAIALKFSLNIDSKEKSTRIYKTFQVLWNYFSSRIFKKFQRKKNDIW